MEEEQIEVLYNGCYGGWVISDEAIQLYNLKMLEKDSSIQPFIKKNKYSFCKSGRDDPILVQIYHEIGKKINGDSASKICIETIPKKYKNYYEITEYDGFESIVINEIKYEYDTLKSTITKILIDDTISSDNKISKLIMILDKNENT